MRSKKLEEKMMIKTYRDLRVYQLSYQLGKEVHQESLSFPKQEQYEFFRNKNNMN